jgi:hypothetical protein
MKTMKKMITLLAVVGMVFALAPAAQAATITYLGSDTNSHASWRSTGVDKAVNGPSGADPDGDNAYGNDGYYVNQNADGSATTVVASSLPPYITSVTTTAGSYSGSPYADIDDPTLPIAETVSPDRDAGVFHSKEDIMYFVLAEDSHFVLTIILGGFWNQNRPDALSLTQTIGGGTTAAATPFPVPVNDDSVDYVFFEVNGTAGDKFKVDLSANTNGGIGDAIHGVAFEEIHPPAGTVIILY